jgi:hypothetical protein
MKMQPGFLKNIFFLGVLAKLSAMLFVIVGSAHMGYSASLTL